MMILPFDIFSISSYDAKEFINHLPKARRKNTDMIEVSTPIDEIVERLNRHQPNLVATYPTYMKMLCNYQKSGKLSISPTIVTTIGEKLTDDIRKDIEDTFGAFVCTTYSCTEGSSMTHECKANHHQHLNDDWLIIEAVDENGNPVEISSISVSMEMHKVGDETELYQFIVHENNEVEIRLKPLERYDKEAVFDKSGKFKEIFQV